MLQRFRLAYLNSIFLSLMWDLEGHKDIFFRRYITQTCRGFRLGRITHFSPGKGRGYFDRQEGDFIYLFTHSICVSVYLLGLLFIYLLWWCADMDFNGTMGRDATVRVIDGCSLSSSPASWIRVPCISLGGELWCYGAMGLWGYGDCVSVLSCPSGQNTLKWHHYNHFFYHATISTSCAPFCGVLPTGHRGWSVQTYCVYSGTVKGRLAW